MSLKVVLASFLLWLSVGLQLLPQVNALKGDSGCGIFLCINATYDGELVTYEMTALREPFGWLALGFGRRMRDTDMVVLWPNDNDGSVTISQRYATGHTEPMPVMSPPRVATLVKPRVTSWHPKSQATLAFSIPANKTLMGTKEPIERLIWAYSLKRPSKLPESVLTQHVSAGFFRLNFTKDVPEMLEIERPTTEKAPEEHHHHVHPDENSPGNMSETVDVSGYLNSHEKIILTHGVLMSLGFLVILPAGSLIARWGRTLTPAWFKAHWICNMLVALPVITIGWFLGPLATFVRQGAHLASAHQTCGVLLVILYYMQVVLGRYIHRRRAEKVVPASKPHPPSNILHVVSGLTIIGLAFFQVHSGMHEWYIATNRPPVPHWCHDLWLAWIVIIPIAYASGLALLPRQFYQERQGVTLDSQNYIVLSDGSNSPNTHLLFNVPEEDDEGFAKEYRPRRVPESTTEFEQGVPQH